MTFPTLTTEIAVSTRPTESPVWVDVSAYTHSIRIRRGRSSARQQPEMGTCEVVLDNSDRRFDPAYAAGPYYGNLLPMRRIRVSAAFSVYTYYPDAPTSWGRPIFTGYVDGWPQTWDGDGTVPRVKVRASDGFKVLAMGELNTTYAAETSDVRIGHVLDDIGWTVGSAWVLDSASNSQLGTTTILAPNGDRMLMVGDTTIQAVDLVAANALQHIIDVAQSEGGLFFIDESGAAWFINRHWQTRPEQMEPWATFGDAVATTAVAGTSGSADLQVSATAADDGHSYNAGVTFVNTASTFSVGKGGNDSQQLMAWARITSVPIPQGATITAAYLQVRTPNTDADTPSVRIFAEDVDNAVAPVDAADRQGKTNTTAYADWTLPASTAGDWYDSPSIVSVVQEIVDRAGWVENNAIQFLINNNGSGVNVIRLISTGEVDSAHAVKLHAEWTTATVAAVADEVSYLDYEPDINDSEVYNDVRVTAVDGDEHTASDATSQLVYFKRTLAEDRLLMASEYEAADRANWLLARYKDPQYSAPSIRFVLGEETRVGDMSWLYTDRELFDRIRVTRRPQGGAAFTKDYHILSIEHQIGLDEEGGKIWEIRWQLAPVDPVTSYWHLSASADPSNPDAYSAYSILGSTTILNY